MIAIIVITVIVVSLLSLFSSSSIKTSDNGHTNKRRDNTETNNRQQMHIETIDSAQCADNFTTIRETNTTQQLQTLRRQHAT